MERGTEDNLGRLYESKILYATNGPGKVSVWTNHGGSDTGKPVRKWKVCVARIWKTRIALYDKFNCAEGVTDILGKEANEAQKTFFWSQSFLSLDGTQGKGTGGGRRSSRCGTGRGHSSDSPNLKKHPSTD